MKTGINLENVFFNQMIIYYGRKMDQVKKTIRSSKTMNEKTAAFPQNASPLFIG